MTDATPSARPHACRIGCLVLLGLGALLWPAAAGAQSATCAAQVQDRIAWDYEGHRSWIPTNVLRLCAGAEDSVEPARCFERVMHGGVDHGGGTRWRWEDALVLCAGTRDAAATIACFASRLGAGLDRASAIDACRRQATTQSDPEVVITLPDPIPFTPVEPVTWSHATASATHVSGVATSAVRPRLGAVAALERFELKFRSEDHKIRRMTVLGEDRFVRFAFNDKEGEDNFWAEAGWAVVSAGRPGTVTAAARGQVELEIEPGPANHTLALTGFEFRRLDGTDANVRSIGIWPLPERNILRAWLIDDMGPDFRGLEETLGAALTAGALVPYGGAIVGGLASTWDFVSRFNAQGGPRPYQLTIQYAWLPNEVLGEEGSASGSTAANEDGWSPGTPHVLQGFRFDFENSDHHLFGLGVMLGHEDHHVIFRDSDFGDPMQWAVQYIELRPDRKRAP